MTTNIGTHGLTCMDGSDYAAISLWMQANAQATDAALVGIRQSLSTFMDRPYWQATNINVINVDSVSGTIGPNGAVGETIGGGTVVSNEIPSSFLTQYRLPKGVYLLQSSVNYTVATPNNNTTRTLMVYGMDSINGLESSQFTNRNLYQVRTLEAGGAGNSGAMSVQGLLFADGVHTRRPESFFTHQNTSSQIVIAAGAWRMSLLFLGSGLVI